MFKLIYDEVALSALSDEEHEEALRLIREAEEIVNRINNRLANKTENDEGVVT